MTAMTDRQTVERMTGRTQGRICKRASTGAEDAERQKFICVYNQVNKYMYVCVCAWSKKLSHCRLAALTATHTMCAKCDTLEQTATTVITTTTGSVSGRKVAAIE